MDNIFYKKVGKYQVTREFAIMTCIKPDWDVITPLYSIEKTGLVTLHVGFAWNGADVVKDTPKIMKGSAVHDAGCRAVLDGLLDEKHKGQIDRSFKTICESDDMHPFRVWYTFTGTDIGSCRGDSLKEYSAPDVDAVNQDRTGGA